MIAANQVRHVAVVGGGTIGASWTAFFLSRGLAVSVYDPEAGRRGYIERYIEAAWATLQAVSTYPLPPSDRWVFCSALADAVADVQFVQESAPENVDLKRALFRELDTHARAEVVIASSTSSLRLTDLQAGLESARRFVVGHPFNPPHLMPLVEVVAGAHTDVAARDWCRAFYELHGKTVLVLKKEVTGHLVNRLQAALFQEAIWLVKEAVAEVADIDRGVALGPALRWALMGPFLTFHLAAQDQGIRGYLRNLGDAHLKLWKDLGEVRALPPELVSAIAEGIDRETAGMPLAELLQLRDRALTSLITDLRSDQRRLVS